MIYGDLPLLSRLYLYAKLVQLLLIHSGGRARHRTKGFLRFREGYDIAYGVAADEERHKAIQSESHAAMRRRAVFERVKKKSEPQLRLAFIDTYDLEYQLLHLTVMDSDTAGTYLSSVYHKII